VPIEVAAWTLTLRLDLPAGDVLAGPSASSRAPGEGTRHRIYDLDAGEEVEAMVVERAALPPGERVEGPALIVEDHTTILVTRGMTACCDAAGFLILRREMGQ
jgi:N-methylhydantoinase A